jgi:type VI secretion system protein ImpC
MWVADQVPAGTPRDQVAKLFTDASTLFLFPGLNDGARLDAGVVDGTDGPAIRLVATVSPRLAAIPFEVGFDLPLRVALGD